MCFPQFLVFFSSKMLQRVRKGLSAEVWQGDTLSQIRNQICLPRHPPLHAQTQAALASSYSSWGTSLQCAIFPVAPQSSSVQSQALQDLPTHISSYWSLPPIHFPLWCNNITLKSLQWLPIEEMCFLLISISLCSPLKGWAHTQACPGWPHPPWLGQRCPANPSCAKPHFLWDFFCSCEENSIPCSLESLISNDPTLEDQVSDNDQDQESLSQEKET